MVLKNSLLIKRINVLLAYNNNILYNVYKNISNQFEDRIAFELVQVNKLIKNILVDCSVVPS